MRRCWCLAVLVLFLSGCGGEEAVTRQDQEEDEAPASVPGWSMYADPAGRFTIELPGPPDTANQNTVAYSPTTGTRIAVTVVNAGALLDGLPVEWELYAADPQNAEAARQLLTRRVEQALDQLRHPTNPNRPSENHVITSLTPIEDHGVAGIDVQIQVEGGRSYSRRLFVTPQWLFELIANVRPGDMADQDVQRVRDSFHITPPKP